VHYRGRGPRLRRRKRRKGAHDDELEGHGLPITVARDGKYTKHAIALRRGDLLALYTDGLVEARRQLAADTTLLKKVLMEKPPSAEAVAQAVLAGAQRDDVALLLARVVDLAAAS
jgi:serine phosphatase RsbU (regulator of sigma subunit)